MSKQSLLFLEDYYVTAKRSVNEMELDRSKARSHAALISHEARRSTRQRKTRSRASHGASSEAYNPGLRTHMVASNNHLKQADGKNSTNKDNRIAIQSPLLQNDSPLPEPCLSHSLGGCWSDPEDRHYLKQWLSIIGPWHACYENTSHGLKHEDRSRDVPDLPATRHLLVAVALLEEPLSSTSSSAITTRKKEITHHYSSAVDALQQADSITLDTIAAAAIAWLFETARADEVAAEIHLRAFDRLEQHFLASRDSIREEDATRTVESIVCRCFECRSSNRFSLREMQKRGLHHFTLLGPDCSAMRSDLALPTILAQIEQYLECLEVHRQNGFTNFGMLEVTALIRRWDLELLKLRHRREHVPNLIFVARLLIMIVVTLLPRQSGAAFILDPDTFAWNFCLFKVNQILHRTELRQLDRQYIGIIATHILKAIAQFASDEKHVLRAADILQVMSESIQASSFK